MISIERLVWGWKKYTSALPKLAIFRIQVEIFDWVQTLLGHCHCCIVRYRWRLGVCGSFIDKVHIHPGPEWISRFHRYGVYSEWQVSLQFMDVSNHCINSKSMFVLRALNSGGIWVSIHGLTGRIHNIWKKMCPAGVHWSTKKDINHDIAIFEDLNVTNSAVDSEISNSNASRWSI